MLIRRNETGQPRASSAHDDARLIGRVVTGDLRAFETLYKAYHSRLSHFLIRLLRRPVVVEEVVNDTMLVVWNRADTYNGQSKVSTWIFAIAYRRALKAMRRMDEPMEDVFADRRQSEEAGPEQQFGQRQVGRALTGAMESLSQDHRAVVHLAYFQELGYREIAEIMDCPVDTVKTRMYHARRNLRSHLAGQLTDWL
ncbi:MAG: sigma-70 family RNA polymerase sigma factor [Asticcacaulis sp.]